MKKLILALLKLLPLKAAIELILNYLTTKAAESAGKWDDEVMEWAWKVYRLLEDYIPEQTKVSFARRMEHR